MTHHTAEHRSQAMNDCILACRQCETTCLETINYSWAKAASTPRRITSR